MTPDHDERKATPMATGLLDYFPDALAAVARLSLKANSKHNPGEPLHWAREKSSDHADALVRHMVDRGKFDDETGELHDVMVAWRALAQLQLAIEKLKASPGPGVKRMWVGGDLAYNPPVQAPWQWNAATDQWEAPPDTAAGRRDPG